MVVALGARTRPIAAMSELPPGLRAGQTIQCILADGTVLRGVVESARKGWIRLADERDTLMVNADHIAVIKGLDAAADALGRGSSGDASDGKGGRAPRAAAVAAEEWPEDDMRQLSDGFLDGHDDAEMAARLGRSKSQVKTLRQAFECARGNMVDDQISGAAQAWVARWRDVLTA